MSESGVEQSTGEEMIIKNSFEKGPEAWCSYDYHSSVIAGRNVFVLLTWERSGGVNDLGYVWTDHCCWSADTPEKPLSILPFIFYRSWIGGEPVDLREAEVSVYIRGDGLQLDGTKCYFWVHAPHTRWHYTSVPVEIPEGVWPAQPAAFTLRNDESLWHRSWALDPEKAIGLDSLLANVHSYGFSFTGFLSEVTGKLSMGGFEISLRNGTNHAMV
jgi:hypothetical protein